LYFTIGMRKTRKIKRVFFFIHEWKSTFSDTVFQLYQQKLGVNSKKVIGVSKNRDNLYLTRVSTIELVSLYIWF